MALNATKRMPTANKHQRRRRKLTSAQSQFIRSRFCHKMAKLKDKRREKISVATEIDRLEERKARCQDNLEKAEFRSRKEQLSDKERQDLEDEMTIINERVLKLDKELETLRGENRKNMVLSVALLVISALFYYIFFYNEEES
ncbi:coiled-coil domain-containing protein 167 [Centropristis striata]|uniref:coiled-coil domain-containing protein 167 n=1 Tax=Centropristis striata TaxID=184440 RepID=UPI0027DFDE33|nr:coiled-coil domain-containing protein 167 [Centropristis striata]